MFFDRSDADKSFESLALPVATIGGPVNWDRST
jgi:hypothetical protein